MEHNYGTLANLSHSLKGRLGETRVIKEYTDRCSEPVDSMLHEIGVYVRVVNPSPTHDCGNNSIRRVSRPTKKMR